MKTKLLIDSTSSTDIIVSLVFDRKEYILKQTVDKRKSQVVLLMIDTILKEHSLKKEDLDEIHVHTGPGSFTGIRVGVSVANALSLVLQIPINGKPPGTVVEPHYV